MMMNKQKSEKKSFKERIIKVLLVAFIGFMIFGAMKSCIKVKAEVTSLQSTSYYSWNLDLATWIVTSGASSNTIVTITASSGYLLSYYDINFTEIRIKRFFPEPSFSEYYIEYYDSNTSNTIKVYSALYDYTNNTPVLLSSEWYIVNTFYLLNNNISYSNITSSNFFRAITEGVIDNYGVIFRQGYDQGYLAGANASNIEVYNKGYNEGRTVGISEGLSDTSNPLVQDAYDNGLEEGKSLGRQEALLEDNDYTFRGLMFAVLQAPVTVFSALFNWDFLGYNLKDFFFTCLTMGCIIAIVRRFF